MNNERVKHETELRQVVRQLTQAVPVGIFAYTLPERIELLANDEAHYLFNHDTSDGEKLAGANVMKYILPEDYTSIRRAVRKLHTSGDSVTYTYRVQRNDGMILTVSSYTKLAQFSDGSEYILSVLRDITDEVMERQRYRDALFSNCLAAMEFDVTENQIEEDNIKKKSLFFPENCEQIFPCTYEELTKGMLGETGVVQKEIQIELQSDNRRLLTTKGLIDEYKLGHKNLEFECYIQPYDRYLRQNILLSQDPNGHIHAILISYDMTPQRREQLAHTKELDTAYRLASEANQAKADFLANMSHDVHTPMNAILGMTQMAKDNLEDKQFVASCLQEIETATGNLLSLVNNVLDMAKLQAGKMEFLEEPFELLEVWEQGILLIAPEAKKNGISIVIHPDEKPAVTRLYGSTQHLRQIFVNLARNAITYNHPGGKLELHLKQEQIDEKVVICEFRFEDDGIGMTPDFMKRMFQPFVQESAGARTHYRGTGLGLSIVKLVVENMGGEIYATSTKNVGSTFVVRMPFRMVV